MTRNEIDKFCESFLDSDLSPEDFFNQLVDNSKTAFSFEDSKLLITLFYTLRYMDERIRFEVEESGFFENNFLAREGFIHRDRFTAMFGLVGLADAVNILFEKEGMDGRFGHSEKADQLGVEIMDIINDFNNNHHNKYCEITGNHFLLHELVFQTTNRDNIYSVFSPVSIF